jgi:transposase-like protein
MLQTNLSSIDGLDLDEVLLRRVSLIVEESLVAGEVVTAVAQHDVHPNLLHHWRRQAKRALEGGQGLKFLPVAVTPALPKSEASIEIKFAGSVRVRVDSAVDEAALGLVLRALGR